MLFMNYIFKIRISLFLLTIISCSNTSLSIDSIKITQVKQHPYLVDHCKKVQIKNKEGELINEQELYCDSGRGCHSYLFREKSDYILIDCNGQWYKINQTNGEISDLGWNWKKDLPEHYIGQFKPKSGENNYVLITDNRPLKKDVYKYKDPQ